jgi:hypothetical protein
VERVSPFHRFPDDILRDRWPMQVPIGYELDS